MEHYSVFRTTGRFWPISTTQVFWLDRGALRSAPRLQIFRRMVGDASGTGKRLKSRKTLVAQEVEWASRGVKARRKRNMRRLEQVRELREQLKSDVAAFRRATSKIDIALPKEQEKSSKNCRGILQRL
ncbi:MAG: hypothetical protein R3D66_02855 [Alphaproteobacteria bacterium]